MASEQKSIEAIWKEGFANDAHLTAPKITNLYNQKSENLGDRFANMFDKNLKAILIGAIVAPPVFILMSMQIFGIALFAGLIAHYILGKKHQRAFENLNKGINSYEYLTGLRDWIHNVQIDFIKLTRIFYPAIFLGMADGFFRIGSGKLLLQEIVQSYPDQLIILGYPLFAWALTAAICLALVIFAGPIYRFDLRLIYGRAMRRLDDTINDMETLRN